MSRLFAVAAVLIVAVEIAPLRSEELPWCVELDVFTKNCTFASYDECAAVAKNATSPATGTGRCIRNPSYQPPQATSHGKPAPAKASGPRR